VSNRAFSPASKLLAALIGPPLVAIAASGSWLC
jgi:hypothetical protein